MPQKHHHDHGTNASVPAKGNARAIPNDHWERHYSLSKSSENMVLTQGADFDPKKGDQRKTTQLKVNKEDH